MIDRERGLWIYKTMCRIRSFEEKAVALFEANKLRGSMHLYVGEEAIAATVCSRLNRDDYIASTHRGHGHCIAKGADERFAMAELMGKATGYCKGRGGSMHIADFTTGNLGANAIVGGGIPIAVGAGLGVGQLRVRGAGDDLEEDGDALLLAVHAVNADGERLRQFVSGEGLLSGAGQFQAGRHMEGDGADIFEGGAGDAEISVAKFIAIRNLCAEDPLRVGGALQDVRLDGLARETQRGDFDRDVGDGASGAGGKPFRSKHLDFNGQGGQCAARARLRTAGMQLDGLGDFLDRLRAAGKQ